MYNLVGRGVQCVIVLAIHAFVQCDLKLIAAFSHKLSKVGFSSLASLGNCSYPCQRETPLLWQPVGVNRVANSQ